MFIIQYMKKTDQAFNGARLLLVQTKAIKGTSVFLGQLYSNSSLFYSILKFTVLSLKWLV